MWTRFLWVLTNENEKIKRKISRRKNVNKQKILKFVRTWIPWSWVDFYVDFVNLTLIHMNDDKEPVEKTEGEEGGENGQITQETLDNANQEVGQTPGP